MVTYETATPEEIAQVLQAISDTDSVPVGYAYNPGWSPPIRKVVGGGADPAAIRAARIVRGAEFDALVGGITPSVPALLLAADAPGAAAVTTSGAVRRVPGRHAEAWFLEGPGTNLVEDPFFTGAGWAVANGTLDSPTFGVGQLTVTSGGATAQLSRVSHAATLIPAGSPVTMTVTVTAPAGAQVRAQVYSRTSTNGLGTVFLTILQTATGARQTFTATTTYPATNVNGRVSIFLACMGPYSAGDVILWEQPQVEVGDRATTFIPVLDGTRQPAPGYTSETGTITGPYHRTPASIRIPGTVPPTIYARYSEDGGKWWQEHILAGGKLGASGTITQAGGSVVITTARSLTLEGLIGVHRRFTREEIDALHGRPLAGATLAPRGIGTAVPALTPGAVTFVAVPGVSATDTVMELSRDGVTLFLRDAAGNLRQSRDNLATVQPVLAAPAAISAIRETDDGELLFAIHRNEDTAVRSKMYKTTGYNPVAGTITSFVQVLESLGNGGTFTSHWGLDVCGPICVASEYGRVGEDGARWGYLSEDYGATWRMIFDQKETPATIPGAPVWGADKAHVHTIHYDRYQDRIWVACGDYPYTAVYYSDDRGATWAIVPNSHGTDVSAVVQFTGIMSFPEGVMFGSDRIPNGVYGWRRASGSDPVRIELIRTINDATFLTHVFQRPYRRWAADGELVVFALGRSQLEDGKQFPKVMGMTGLDNPVMLATFAEAGSQGPTDVVGPTRDGYIYATFKGTTYRARAPFLMR